MEREATNIDREFRMIEQSYVTDHLDLVLATGYLARLIENVSVVHHLARHHPELLAESQRIAQLPDAPSPTRQTAPQRTVCFAPPPRRATEHFPRKPWSSRSRAQKSVAA